MAARGEVLALRRSMGFLPGARLEHFVVVQADKVTRSIETVLVAPLDVALDVYGPMPGAVPVSPEEAGTDRNQVMLLTQLTTLSLERFAPAAVGKLEATTRARMNTVLRLVLDLT